MGASKSNAQDETAAADQAALPITDSSLERRFRPIALSPPASRSRGAGEAMSAVRPGASGSGLTTLRFTRWQVAKDPRHITQILKAVVRL